ncbi:MAG TPA: DsrE family protein [archaeon]|nr:DsrE family protein [archaeon]HLD80663.1 DsrE family protein [archaeon]
MKLGIVLNSNDPETTWNAFRFGVEALERGHSVRVFLLGKGVECGELRSSRFDVQGMIGAFKEKNGAMLACGTCLRLRNREESKVCPVSTMDGLLEMVEESDKVLAFG